ncbi:VWA domain-containing protein [Ruminococcus sp. OM05-10BH]|nr:VWA domain-containing protein [Ruminococcus sp. OM05-10BH]
MKGKLKCVVALLLCMTMVFGTNLSTLADTNTAVPQTVQVQEAEQTAQEGEAAQTTGEQQQTQETQETSSGETQTQQETQTEETQGEQTTQTKEEQTVQEEEKTEQKTAQTPESQGETKAQTDEEESAEVKEETTETEVTTETEQTTEGEEEEKETQDATHDINQMSAKEAYEYLSGIENDAEYYKAWDSLNDTKEKELLDYINEVTAGEEVTYSPGTSAVNFALAAPLVVENAIDAKTARNIILNSEEENGSFNTSDKTTPDDGVVLSKKLVTDGEGSPYLQLESFVTGSVTSVDKRVPVDIVLVLDQSGSMADSFSGDVFRRQYYSNDEAYQNRNQTLYVYQEQKYRQVSITREGQENIKYSAVSSKPFYRDVNSGDGGTGYYIERDNQYYEIFVSVERQFPFKNVYSSYYKTESGNVSISGETEKSGNDRLCSRETIYSKVDNGIYTYTYTYQNDEEENISKTSIGANEEPPMTLYIKRSNGTRLDALQNAVTGFVNSVEADAKESGANHRIAITGFSSDGFNNTEILTGCEIKTENPIRDYNSNYYPTGMAKNGVQFNTYSSDYQTAAGNALQEVNNTNGSLSIYNAVEALTAHGGTQTDDGLKMAEDIFEAQSDQYKDEYASGSRKKVVIVFTDGEPTGSGSNWSSTTAQSAISSAKNLKDDQTTVYSVGIFDNADGTIGSDGEPNSPSYWRGNNNDPNKFMHLISSNYLSASGMNTDKGDIAELTKDEEGNYRSYYLSAGDTDGLNNVFQSISDEIGGATIDLNEKTVLYDAISDSFALPEGIRKEDIKVFTSDCIAVRTNEEYVFDSRLDPFTANISVDEASNLVKVWGFNYGQNYVGEKDGRAVGKKIVVQIPIDLSTKYTFGGNGIPTNKNTSGLYDATGTTCYGNLEIPMVNIPIDYKIAAEDQTIYRTNQADLSQLLTYVENYRPNGINNKYVTIEYKLKEGNTVLGTYKIEPGTTEGQWTWTTENAQNPALAQCTEYELSCTVTPTTGKPAGSIDYHEEATTKTIDPENASVHVLVPKIELKDQQIFLGETIDVNSSILSLENQKWIDLKKHATSNLIGKKPSVTITPELVEGTSTENGLDNYQPNQDSNFRVNVQINDESDLERGRDYQVIPAEPIDDKNCWKPIEKPKDHDFTIHVVAGEIDITKVLKDAEKRNPDLEGDPIFTFKIAGNGNVWYRSVKFSQNDTTANAEILQGLPKGKYTITELSTIRYENTEVVVKNDIPHKIDGTNEVTVCIGYKNADDDETDIEKRIGQVEFQNTRKESSKLTDSDIRLNRFTKSGDTWECEQIEIPQSPEKNS